MKERILGFRKGWFFKWTGYGFPNTRFAAENQDMQE